MDPEGASRAHRLARAGAQQASEQLDAKLTPGPRRPDNPSRKLCLEYRAPYENLTSSLTMGVWMSLLPGEVTLFPNYDLSLIHI